MQFKLMSFKGKTETQISKFSQISKIPNISKSPRALEFPRTLNFSQNPRTTYNFLQMLRMHHGCKKKTSFYKGK